MKTYKSRDEVPVQETWDLTDIYPRQQEWEKDYEKVVKMAEELKTYEGAIASAQDLYDFLHLDEQCDYVFSKVYVYAMLLTDIDTRSAESQALLDRARQLSVKLQSSTSFFMPFLLELDRKTLDSYIKQIKGLKYFEEDLYDSYRFKKHVLNKDKEEVLSQLGEALSSPGKTFGMINNADIKFGKVTNKDGEKVELTRGMYSRLIEDEDREVRKEAYKAYYEPYIQLQNTIASTLSSAIKNNAMTSTMRNYPSSLEKALFKDKVPASVYDNLIKATKDNIEPFHQYMRMRKKILNLDELRAYDLNAPLVPGMKQDITFEEAYETMVNALAPLGNEYTDLLKYFKEHRYIDVRETPGKRSGAYNIGLYGVHPYVLLNHQDDLDSLFTLAHEMGHAMHSYYSSKYQPQITAGYTIFVAEVASTVNEILLIHYLLNNTKDTEKKKHLLNHFIDQFRGTFFTQVMFAEFEQLVHDKAENGEPLNVTAFNNVYEKLFRQYNGEELVFDEEVKHGWSRIPHFYRPFYVYKYATGFASAILIADQLLAGNEEMKKSYLTFLKSGSSEDPLDLLKKTGVDLTSPEPIKHALTSFKGLIDEFAAMTDV